MPDSGKHVIGSVLQSKLIERLSNRLHLIFLLFSVPQIIFLAIWTPPLQSPDEPAHLARAYEIAHGHLFGPRPGAADGGIQDLVQAVANLPHHPDARYSPGQARDAVSIRWTGRLTFTAFSNTMMYPLTGYIPQAAALIACSAFHASVTQTLVAVRLVNGLSNALLCAFALALCKAGRTIMFAVLLLPMTLSLFASASQDAALIAFVCLAIALISRALDGERGLTVGQFAMVAVLLFLASISRPPYAALLLILFIPGLVPRWRKVTPFEMSCLVILAVTSFTCVWWLASLSSIKSLIRPNPVFGLIDARLQLLSVIHHPIILFHLVLSTAAQWLYIACSMIGILGWLDTSMPTLYYLGMLATLLFAAFAECTSFPGKNNARALCVAGPVIAAGTVYFIQYLIWTPVGSQIIDDLQGRYIIPCVLAAAVGLRGLVKSQRTYRLSLWIVLLAQPVTAAVLPHVILTRYYGR